MGRWILGLILVIALISSYAQDSAKISRKLQIIPFPAIAANPTAGFMYGVAPSATWYLGDPADTRISSFLGTVIYTTKDQLIITAKATTFFNHDSWNLLTDMRFFITSQPTYGLGTGPYSAKPFLDGDLEFSDNLFDPIPDEQMMYFNYFRFHQTLMKRYKRTSIYAGLGIHYDQHYKIDDRLLDVDPSDDTVTLTSHYIYNVSEGFDPLGYTLSGFSINLLYDSRDNVVNPYSGRFAYANIRINPTFLGSDQSSTLLWLEYRDYIHFSKTRPRHLLGFWTYGWYVTSGNVPYLDLPAVGWDQFGRSGRAYTQGRFRGEQLMYFETEYRFPLQRHKERFGGVVFVNATTANNKAAGISLLEYFDPAWGIGLRVMINKNSRANINFDYAWGKYGAQGFYFGINEVF